ncbi:MAG: hypothetical protein U1D06_03305 [Paracoccaceae bacterium]|nr:hypothetical protein [Paracoccaceae bacterium]
MRTDYRIAPETDLLILSFPMHFTWEFLQAPLFSSMQAATHMDGIRICLQAALGDMGIVLAAYWAVSILTGTRQWVSRPSRRAIVVWLVVGLAITIGIEFFSTEIIGRWNYGASMPRLPLIGTGIAPLLQWIVVPMLVLWYMRRLSQRAA